MTTTTTKTFTWTENFGQKSHEGLMSRQFWEVHVSGDKTDVFCRTENSDVTDSAHYRWDMKRGRHTLLGSSIALESGENGKNLARALVWAKNKHTHCIV